MQMFINILNFYQNLYTLINFKNFTNTILIFLCLYKNVQINNIIQTKNILSIDGLRYIVVVPSWCMCRSVDPLDWWSGNIQVCTAAVLHGLLTPAPTIWCNNIWFSYRGTRSLVEFNLCNLGWFSFTVNLRVWYAVIICINVYLILFL